MTIKKKHISLLVGLIVFLFTILTENKNTKSNIFPAPTASVLSIATGEAHFAKVIKIVDGDTIKLDNGKTVRYIGIDAPETRHPKKGVQCFGKIATEKNRELVEGKGVRLEKDLSETDRNKRLLRFVYVEEQTATGTATIFVNDYLVRQGYALASTYPPDVRFQVQFREAEKEARDNNRGLWAGCSLLRQ